MVGVVATKVGATATEVGAVATKVAVVATAVVATPTAVQRAPSVNSPAGLGFSCQKSTHSLSLVLTYEIVSMSLWYHEDVNRQRWIPTMLSEGSIRIWV